MIESNTYSEVFEILSYMNKEEVMKIPMEILKNIEERRNRNYISKIEQYDIFNFDNISKQTIEVLAWLDVNFWMESSKVKKLKNKRITEKNENKK